MTDTSRIRFVAALDQLSASLRDIAKMIGGYRQQLIDAGMPEDDALDLCLDLQRAVIFDGEDR